MNDIELLKALELWHKQVSDARTNYLLLMGEEHEETALHEATLLAAIKFMYRIHSEIERLQNECFCLSNERDAYKDVLDTAVAEAVKEFANETIDWCRQKLAQEKKNPFGLTGKRLEGYEQAILSVMSYLHSKKE